MPSRADQRIFPGVYSTSEASKVQEIIRGKAYVVTYDGEVWVASLRR